jgi:hypothetical protein
MGAVAIHGQPSKARQKKAAAPALAATKKTTVKKKI